MQVTFNECMKLCHKWVKNKETSVPWVWILRKYLKITRDRGALICPSSWRFTQEKGEGISSRRTLAQFGTYCDCLLSPALGLPWHILEALSFPILGRGVLISLILSLQLGFSVSQGQSLWENCHVCSDILKRVPTWLRVLPTLFPPLLVNSGQNGTYSDGGKKKGS